MLREPPFLVRERMRQFHPHLDVLPAPQRHLWLELGTVPAEFTLYGGTAIALHLGHRHSIDFDFFGNRPLDLSALEARVPFLSGARIIQRERNTLSVVVQRGGGRVQVSFFGVPNLPRLEQPLVSPDNGLRIASLLDLAGTKASVIQLRAEAKDYLDMDALMTRGNMGLPTALAAAQKIYGSSFNPEITLKALSYFDDGNLRTLPDEMKQRLAFAARDVDLEHLPDLHYEADLDLDHGL
jgi:hypothetical protein